MSLYYVQKLLYNLNRDPALKERFDTEQGVASIFAMHDLTHVRDDARKHVLPVAP